MSRGRRGWLVVAVAAVVVAVVIATLFASGILPGNHSSSGGPTYATFSQAEALASAGAGSESGGAWFAVFGAGVASPTAVLEPATNLTSLLALANCSIEWPDGQPANLAIPSTPATAATGAAAFWVFGFKNVSNDLLVELVSAGVASPLFRASGTTCAGGIAFLAPFPAGVLDSPAIVATADQAGGSEFLAAHPNATRVWGAYGGIQLGVLGSTSPVWSVDYTTCSIPPVSGEVGAVFNATLGGTSGAIINSSTSSAACAAALPTGLSLTAHVPAESFALRKAI